MAFLRTQLFNAQERVFAVACADERVAYVSSNVFGSVGEVVYCRIVGRQLVELDRASVAGYSLVFCGNGNGTLACGGRRDIVLFDVSADTLKRRRGVLRGHTDVVRGVAAHGDWLASGSWDRTVRIWSMTMHEQLHCKTGHTDEVYSVCFSHDGRWLASGGYDKSVIVYDATRDFARRATLTLKQWVHAVCFSPDDSLLAVGAHNGCSAIYSVGASFELLRTLAGDHHSVRCVAWLGNDAASLVGGTREGELVVWSTSTGSISSQEKVHDDCFKALSLTSSFRCVLTCGADRTARVFDVYDRRESRATAALYGASLHVFRTLRRTNLGTLVMQLVAEALVGSLEPLSEHERTRIFTASRVTSVVRAARLKTLHNLKNFHARMHWLRTSTPAYAGNELETLGEKR